MDAESYSTIIRNDSSEIPVLSPEALRLKFDEKNRTCWASAYSHDGKINLLKEGISRPNGWKVTAAHLNAQGGADVNSPIEHRIHKNTPILVTQKLRCTWAVVSFSPIPGKPNQQHDVLSEFRSDPSFGRTETSRLACCTLSDPVGSFQDDNTASHESVDVVVSAPVFPEDDEIRNAARRCCCCATKKTLHSEDGARDVSPHEKTIIKAILNRWGADDFMHRSAKLRRCMCRPKSGTKWYWDLLMQFGVIFIGFWVPFRIAFEVQICPGSPLAALENLLDSLFLVDIFVSFRTA